MTDGAEGAAETGSAAGRARRAAWARLVRRSHPAPGGAGDGGARVPLVARAGHLEYDRILFFSDAVFAIAITLLVIDLPEQVQASGRAVHSARLLRDAVPSIYGFLISFVVIGVFWVSHHGLFRFISGFDRRLILLNLLFLGSIAFLPFPTALQNRGSNNETPAVVFYAACVGLCGLLLAATWAYACLSKADLITGLSTRSKWFYFLSIGRVPVVFAASIGIAQVSVRWAQYSWLAIVVLDILLHRFFRQPDSAGVAVPELPPD